MRSPYTPNEIKASMALKRLTKLAIAQKMNISSRTLDYFISGRMGMNRGDEFLQMLQPELTEICKVRKRVKNRKTKHCEVDNYEL